MKIYRIYIAFIFLFSLEACDYFQREDQETERKVIARVDNQYLYLDDIRDLGLQAASPEDSIRIVDGYIENWIQEKLKLLYAYENLSPDQLDVERQVQDYKESLIVYAYETQFVKQNLDTSVSEEEIRQFYQEKREDFKLQDDIARFLYVKIPIDAPNEDSVKMWLQSDDLNMKGRLLRYVNLHAIAYNLDDSMWFDRLMVKRKISNELADKLDKGIKGIIEIRDTSFTIFARILEFKAEDSVAPLSYVKENIKRMIINKRKLDLARKLTNDIMQQAAREKKFEIYK